MYNTVLLVGNNTMFPEFVLSVVEEAFVRVGHVLLDVRVRTVHVEPCVAVGDLSDMESLIVRKQVKCLDWTNELTGHIDLGWDDDAEHVYHIIGDKVSSQLLEL